MRHAASCLTLVLLLISSAYAHRKDVSLTKKVEVRQAASPQIKVQITNKYGRLDIRTWDKDSLWMQAQITATGRDRTQAERVLGRVHIQYDASPKHLSAQTQYQSGGDGGGQPALINSFMNMLTDTKVVLNQSNVTVDYTLYVPRAAILNLDNKFGDLIIGDLDGSLQLSLAHGNLRAGKIDGARTHIRLNFGEGKIADLKAATLDVQFAQLTIEKGGELRWKGISSELRAKDLQQLDCIDSRKDKMHIQTLQKLKGRSQFSKIEVWQLHQSLQFDAAFGELDIQQLDQNFETFDLTADKSNVFLQINRQTSYRMEVNAPDDRFDFPDIWQQFLADNDPMTENALVGGIRIIRGSVGSSPTGLLHIRTQGGRLTIQD